MKSQTTTQDIKEKVDEKPGFFDSMISRAMKEQENNLPPKCYLCQQRIYQGSMLYNLPSGEIVSICSKCTLKAIGYYIKNREEGL
jgi:hypothetical protein